MGNKRWGMAEWGMAEWRMGELRIEEWRMGELRMGDGEWRMGELRMGDGGFFGLLARRPGKRYRDPGNPTHMVINPHKPPELHVSALSALSARISWWR